jgi:hypothetical protein
LPRASIASSRAPQEFWTVADESDDQRVGWCDGLVHGLLGSAVPFVGSLTGRFGSNPAVQAERPGHDREINLGTTRE